MEGITVQARGFWQAVVQARWFGYATALLAVALVSGLIGLVLGRVSIPNISMLYLVAVLAIAIAYGRGPAILASVAAFLTFDWFFLAPHHTFTIADPGEWVALLLFLLVAIVTGQLAARERQRAREAEQREREAVVLSDVVRLMSEADLDGALRAVAERLRQELGLAAVGIDLEDDVCQAAPAVAGEPEALGLETDGAPAVAAERPPGPGPQPAHVAAERRPGDGSPEQRAGGRSFWPPPAAAQQPGGISPERRAAVPAHERVRAIPVEAQNRRVGTLRLAYPPARRHLAVADDRLLAAVAAQLGLAVERARLRREATEAETLRRTDELKDALLNAVSHDLRTPLASIIASAGSLRQRDVAWSDAERAEFTEAIEEQAQRLDRIVGNLLDLSRIEAGAVNPQTDWCDLQETVARAADQVRGERGEFPVRIDLPSDLPLVRADAAQLERVFSNLIDNAAKFSPSDKPVEVRGISANGRVTIRVVDHGRGIPAAEHAQIFKPFVRGSNGQRGSGLGLAICRGFVEANGGRITLQSRGRDGSAFAVSFPAARQPLVVG
jgi:two-component system, OmpR family, sensor histidine kinase KdpD